MWIFSTTSWNRFGWIDLSKPLFKERRKVWIKTFLLQQVHLVALSLQRDAVKVQCIGYSEVNHPTAAMNHASPTCEFEFGSFQEKRLVMVNELNLYSTFPVNFTTQSAFSITLWNTHIYTLICRLMGNLGLKTLESNRQPSNCKMTTLLTEPQSPQLTLIGRTDHNKVS